MGLRLYSEFKSLNGAEYRIEIYDTDWSIASSSFNVSGDGFKLKYQGDTDNIVSPIIGSSITINALNTGGTFSTFLEQLQLNQENRFTVKVLRNSTSTALEVADLYSERVIADGGEVEALTCVSSAVTALGGTEELFWTGTIMQDLVSVEDSATPSVVQIIAVDGISRLAQQDYQTSATKTIDNIIKDVATAAVDTSLYSASDPLFATVMNVWDVNQTYSTTTDVATLTRFSTRVYSGRDADATMTYSTYYEVLRELCIVFGARFYQRGGTFVFEQYMERTSDTRTIYYYDTVGAQLSSRALSDDLTIDQTIDGARMGGNVFNYLPALKRVEVRYNQERISNLLANRLTFTSSTPAQAIGFVTDSNSAQIMITGVLNYRFDYDGSGATTAPQLYRPVWRILLRIEDASNPGTYKYLKRTYAPSGGTLYGAVTWENSLSYYEVDAGAGNSDANGLYLSTKFSVITPALPLDGEAELDVNFLGIYDPLSTTTKSVPTNYNATSSATEVTATFIDTSGIADSVLVYSSVNASTNSNSNLTLNLGEVRVSDSSGLQGSLYVYNGSTWQNSTVWRRGNSGTYQSILNLTTSEVLSLHAKPVERYQGGVIGEAYFGRRYYFDGAYWLMMMGTFTANTDEWDGEWFKVAKDATNISAETPTGSGGASSATARVASNGGEVVVAEQISTDALTGDSVQLAGGTGTQGTITWDTDELTLGLDTGGATVFFGQDVVYNVRNNSGSDISKGVAVMATGSMGAKGRITIAPMDATGDVSQYFYLGITAQEIANGEDGKVLQLGKITDIDTSAWTTGDVLWLDPTTAGGLTVTQPSAPNLKVPTAFVVHSSASVGVLAVRVNPGYNIEDLHNVEIDTPTDGQVLKYNATTRVWYNADLT